MTKDWTVNELKQKLETDIPQPEYEGGWNPDIEEQLKLYKDFQTEFPVAKIRNLTLKEYNNTERKNFEKLSYSAVGNLKGNDFGALVKKAFV